MNIRAYTFKDQSTWIAKYAARRLAAEGGDVRQDSARLPAGRKPTGVASGVTKFPPEGNGHPDDLNAPATVSPEKPFIVTLKINDLAPPSNRGSVISSDGPINLLGGGSWKWPGAGQLDKKTLEKIVWCEVGGEVIEQPLWTTITEEAA